MRQVFEANNMLRRIVCAVLVAVMVFAMIPAVAPRAEAVSENDTLFFKPNTNWKKDNAWFAAYFFGNGDTFQKMTDSDNDGIYVCKVPVGGYKNVIFIRMNPSASTPSFDYGKKWNQTGDLSLNKGNFYTQNENSGEWGGSDDNNRWSTRTCPHNSHDSSGVCKGCLQRVDHSYDSNGNCSCGVKDPNYNPNPTYYLVGSINGEDYGIEDDYENLGDYKFVNGTLTATFTAKTDVMLKTDTNKWYMTKTYVKENTATFYNCADYPDEAIQKMNIPVGVEVTFTLTENADGTLTLSYTTGACLHSSHDQNGNCTVCGETVGHSFSEATCTAPKTCSICGATEGTTGEHSWTNATCTTPKTCSICGATEGDALGHSIANGSCSRCGGKVVAYLVGQMNSWNQTSLPMIGTDSNTGSVTIELTKASYEFKIKIGDNWYGNSGTIEDSTSTTSTNGWDMSSSAKNCTLKASGGTYTFTFNKNTNKLVILHNSSGGGSVATVVDLNTGTFEKDNDKLYIGTTFYDYYTDHEISGNNLDSRDKYSNGNWYIFDNFNRALSKYYSDNSALVPIYMGHFQPTWDTWKFTYKKHNVPLYGFEDGQAYGSNGNKDQKFFMSVNNSNMNMQPTLNHVYEASWGIVKSTLDSNNNLIAAGTNATLLPMFNETFLLNEKIGNVYHNVQFPFSKEDLYGDGIMYWVFDSLDTTLEMKKNTTSATDESAPKYYLDDITDVRDQYGSFKNLNAEAEVQDQYGFFPFNEGSSSSNANTYNYGFGTRLDIPFNLTSDGKIADKYGDKQDIVFEFSGDDDVWVFIDGVLVLDIGGSHGRVEGSINFATMTSTVSAVKSSGGNHNPVDADSSKPGYQTKFELPKGMTEEHTLTMFYMERGMWESNMSIKFNFIPKSDLWAPTTSFSVMKQWNVANTGVIPSSVTVQLQRRLQGAGTWTDVENQTLTSANQSTQRVDNVWVYKWDNLPNFDAESETLYEYRVVELDADGNVLSNGEKNGNTMVAYGDVSGSGATGYTQVISNNQVSDPVVVVIDFGLSVDVTVTDSATLVGVGNTLKLPVGNSTSVDSNVVQEVEGLHGVATVNGNKIRYTPNNMMMDSADNIGFCVNLGNGQYNYSTLTVIPAANIYYEDEEKFMHFKDATGANANFGKWTVNEDGSNKNTDGTIKDNVQAVDRPGNPENALEDADNVYGYDQAYDSFTKYSLGSAHKVTVNADTGKPNTAPSVSFSFTGTGFDVVSLTDSKSGVIMVDVKQNGISKVSYIVDNYYGMKYDEDTDSWTADNESTGCLYQVPVIKVEGLEYGTYDVTIKAAYLAALDKTTAEGYTIWLDAVRTYNPALNDKTSNDAYLADGESNPHLTTLKKLLIEPDFDVYDENNAEEEINGVVFIDGISRVVSMAKYANQGPNNETYLKNGNAVTFKFRVKDRDDIDPKKGPQIDLQIGAKLAIGNEATLKVGINSSTASTHVVTVETATNMFYKLPDINWKQVTEVKDGVTNVYYESDPILFECEADDGNILSLTDLKLTGPHADFATYVSADDNTAEGGIQTFADYECYFYAVNVMSAREVNPVTLEGKGFTLSFEDEIMVNLYYALSDTANVTEHGMLVFNTNPGTADIAVADQQYATPVYCEDSGLYACTTTGIAAKEMGDSRYYCAYAKLSDGTVVYSDLRQYSPKEYAMSRLENSENENLKALCVAMLNYGAAAQTYFGYKTDALMNADLTAEQQGLVAAYNPDLFTGAVAADPAKTAAFAATETGFSRRRVTVSFEGAFALNFYLQLDREDCEVSFYYWTEEAYNSVDELMVSNASGMLLLQPGENGFYHAPVTGIAAKELDDTIYVAATYTIGGETFCTGVIPYSISTYCMKHANGNMGQLAQATAMYGYYAESYFGVLSQELI